MRNSLNQCLFWILVSSKLFGQADLKFEYKLSDFKEPVKSRISILKPDLSSEELYFDSVRTILNNRKMFFNQIGKYELNCDYSINNQIIDSTKYAFNFDGKGFEIELSVHLGQQVNSKWINNKWTEMDRKNTAYISVIKYSEAPQSIYIQLDNKESDEYYKGPFFKLTNRSKDTIYGEYLPGYFWGCLSFMINDSTWSKKRTGTIDDQFIYLPPLPPDSDRIASVGSFGLFKICPPRAYHYELLYSKSGNSHGYHEYSQTNSTKWWAKTEEFFKLNYNFTIK
jgi:hypothetical protein